MVYPAGHAAVRVAAKAMGFHPAASADVQLREEEMPQCALPRRNRAIRRYLRFFLRASFSRLR